MPDQLREAARGFGVTLPGLGAPGGAAPQPGGFLDMLRNLAPGQQPAPQPEEQPAQQPAPPPPDPLQQLRNLFGR